MRTQQRAPQAYRLPGPGADVLQLGAIALDPYASHPGVVPELEERRSHSLRGLAHDSTGFGLQTTEDKRYTRLADPRLLASDRRQTVAQVLGMIPGHIRDRCDLGQQHIGRVQAPAQPHLSDDEIHPRLGEAEERKRRRRLEERGTQRLGQRAKPACTDR